MQRRNLVVKGFAALVKTPLGITQQVVQQVGADFGGYKDGKLDGGDDVLSLDYTEFVAPLIKAIQELSAGLDAARAEIAAMKAGSASPGGGR